MCTISAAAIVADLAQDVCDKIGASESGYVQLGYLQEEYPLIRVSGRDAVAAMIKRLAHRNANVQLYTLEVSLDDLWSMCGWG